MQTDPQFTYYSYVTWDDLVHCFGNDLVLTVRNYDLYKSSFIKVGSSYNSIDCTTVRYSNGKTSSSHLQVPQYEGNLQIQSDCRSIEVKLVLNEPRQPLSDPLCMNASDGRAADDNAQLDSDDDGSVESKRPSLKRKSIRSANNNDKERSSRDESPDTTERNELAKILFSASEKKFKRNLDQQHGSSNECKWKMVFFF